MVQVSIMASTAKKAAHKFRKRYPGQEVYNVTKTFYSHKETKPNERRYRVTGLPKKMIPPSKRIYK